MGLILGGVSASDLIMDGRSVSLYVGGNPPTKVWPTREVVSLSGSGTAPRDQLLAALTARGLKEWRVKEIPFDLDTSQVTRMGGLFESFYALTQVPDMDTSRVTNMVGMFRSCYKLKQVPDMDTSNVTDMNGMFHGCAALTQVPDMDTSNVTDVGFMFYGCSSLTDGNVRLIGKRRNVDTTYMIDNSGLTRKPFYDTSGNPI